MVISPKVLSLSWYLVNIMKTFWYLIICCRWCCECNQQSSSRTEFAVKWKCNTKIWINMVKQISNITILKHVKDTPYWYNSFLGPAVVLGTYYLSYVNVKVLKIKSSRSNLTIHSDFVQQNFQVLVYIDCRSLYWVEWISCWLVWQCCICLFKCS